MILGIDIGNSNIVIGCIDRGKILSVSRIVTNASMSVCDCLGSIKNAAEESAVSLTEIEGAVISSVVCPLTAVMSKAVHTLTGIEPLIMRFGLKTGLDFSVENPEKLGCDRIADCAAVAEAYPLPAAVIDFGTATTISVIDSKSVFIGGAIAPGLKLSARVLSEGTSQLPAVELDVPPNSCIGKNTQECIKSGIILGAACMVDGVLSRIESDLGMPVCAIATGGFARTVAPHCMRKLILDENLLLRGLGIIYEMNKNA